VICNHFFHASQILKRLSEMFVCCSTLKIIAHLLLASLYTFCHGGKKPPKHSLFACIVRAYRCAKLLLITGELITRSFVIIFLLYLIKLAVDSCRLFFADCFQQFSVFRGNACRPASAKNYPLCVPNCQPQGRLRFLQEYFVDACTFFVWFPWIFHIL
jgi:hypothetical protein